MVVLRWIKKTYSKDPQQHIMQVWDEFDQGIIDASVKQWHRRACLAANGGQFEHEL